MTQSIILITTVVDGTIKEYFKDVKVTIYGSIVELAKHLEQYPERVDKLLITSETMEVAPTAAFNELIKIVDNNFFKCEELIYLSSPGHPTLSVLDFIVTDNKIPKPTIVQGALNREFLVSVIKGTYRDSTVQTRISVERQRRSAYVDSQLAEQRRSKQTNMFDDEAVVTDEKHLREIEDQQIEGFRPIYTDTHAKTIQIVGNRGRGKTTFMLLLGQFISRNHKVIIIENDLDFFSLSSFIKMSNIECTEIDISMLYSDPVSAQAAVSNSPNNLIAVVGNSGIRQKKYSKSFIHRMCFSMFASHADYILLESAIPDMMPATKTVMVLKNELIPILEDSQIVPFQMERLDFVALSSSTIYEGQIINSGELTRCVSELLNVPIEYAIPIYQVTSHRIGGSVYDLHRYM